MTRPFMASLGLLAIQDSIPGRDHALASLSAFLNTIFVHPGAFVERTKEFLCGAYDTLEILAPFHTGIRPSLGITTTEFTDLESGLEIPNASQELEDGHLDDADGSEDVQPATMGERLGLVEELSSHPYQVFMRISAHFLGHLSLIVVPGLVLGVITGQLSWDVALCGAFATVLSSRARLHK